MNNIEKLQQKYWAERVATAADNLYEALLAKDWDTEGASDFVLAYFKGAGSE